MKEKIIFFLLCVFVIPQISAQNNSSEQLVRSTTGVSGSSETISANNNAYIVQQSIGQASAIGTFNNIDYILRQGFIQPNVLSTIIDKSISLDLKTIIYPNPFVESISISFTEKVSDNIEVYVFDVVGRMVFSKSYSAEQNLTVPLNNLSVSSYIIKVLANKKQFVKSIIKK
jgi:hypothetical protein